MQVRSIHGSSVTGVCGEIVIRVHAPPANTRKLQGLPHGFSRYDKKDLMEADNEFDVVAAATSNIVCRIHMMLNMENLRATRVYPPMAPNFAVH